MTAAASPGAGSRPLPRALFLTDSLYAVSESFVTALLAAVRSLPVEVDVVASRIAGEGALDGVTLLRRDFRRGTPRWAADRLLRLAGRRWFEIGLRRLLRQRRYDVLHAQFGTNGYHLWRALPRAVRGAARGAGSAGIGNAVVPPLVVNFYGYDATGLVRDVPAWRGRYRAMFAYPGLRAIAEGPRMRDTLIELGCPPERAEVIPLCLRLNASALPAPASEPPAGDGGVVLGFVGRFVEKKGLAFALEALAPLLQAHPEVRLRLIGDGPERPRVAAIVAAHRLERQVAFAGMMDYARMLAEVRAMSALLVPSRTARNGDSEGGAPTVVAEAQLLGVPVLASDHADIPFVLADRAYMFHEADAESLAATVERFLADGGGACDTAAAQRRTAERHAPAALRRLYGAAYGLGAGGDDRL
jgi:glycosyltransferase involved in cell wall biosynthesis